MASSSSRNEARSGSGPPGGVAPPSLLQVVRCAGGHRPRGDIRPAVTASVTASGGMLLADLACRGVSVRKPLTSDDGAVGKGFHEHPRVAGDNSVCNSGPDSTRPPGPAADSLRFQELTAVLGALNCDRRRDYAAPASGSAGMTWASAPGPASPSRSALAEPSPAPSKGSPGRGSIAGRRPSGAGFAPKANPAPSAARGELNYRAAEKCAGSAKTCYGAATTMPAGRSRSKSVRLPVRMRSTGILSAQQTCNAS